MSMRMYMDAVNGVVSGRLDERTLFRGDSSLIDKFDFAKTDTMALFKQGIYLTDDPAVAADYTLKGGKDGNTVFDPAEEDEDKAATSPKDLVALYLRHIIFNELGLEAQVGALRDPILARFHDNEITRAQSTAEFEAGKRKLLQQMMKQAKKIYAERSKTMKMVQTTLGHYRFVGQDREGYVSSFEVPDEYIERCVHGDVPLPDHVISAIRDLWLDGRDPSTLLALRAYDGKGNEKQGMSFDAFIEAYKRYGASYAWEDHDVGGQGQNPSLDVLMTGTHFGGGWFHSEDNLTKFIALMNRSGYVGIVYHGGTRVGSNATRGGGGLLHNAYCFWDADAINHFRTGSEKVADPDMERGLEKGIRLSRKLYAY